jgi:hypothetical protein
MKALYPDGVASKRATTAVKSASTTAQAVASTSASANTSGNVNVLAYRSPNSHAAPSTARQADAWPTLLAENL